jgi:hypothetical protein
VSSSGQVRTVVTDAGLRHLEAFGGLEYLGLRGCPDVTGEGVARLRKALRGCTINPEAPDEPPASRPSISTTNCIKQGRDCGQSDCRDDAYPGGTPMSQHTTAAIVLSVALAAAVRAGPPARRQRGNGVREGRLARMACNPPGRPAYVIPEREERRQGRPRPSLPLAITPLFASMRAGRPAPRPGRLCSSGTVGGHPPSLLRSMGRMALA